MMQKGGDWYGSRRGVGNGNNYCVGKSNGHGNSDRDGDGNGNGNGKGKWNIDSNGNGNSHKDGKVDRVCDRDSN
jgi:hypothetical protein